MAFEIVPARRFGPGALTPNACRIRGDGVAVIHREAAAKVGIVGDFVLLVDKESERIAVRKVHPDDSPDNVVKVRSTKAAKGLDQVCLPIAAALRMGGWTVLQGKSFRFFGMQPVVVREDGLLIIHLENPPEGTALARTGGRRK